MNQLMDYRFDNMHRFVVLNLKLILCGIVKSRIPDCLPDAKGSDHMTNENDGANVWVGFMYVVSGKTNEKKDTINHVHQNKNMLKILIKVKF